jgi:broad specificity phosphatase PhoE
MNYLLPLDQLSNRYFVMRHGQSQANLQALVVSHPQNGIDGYGLSEQGIAQVRESVQADTRFDSSLVIISSDFKRAKESAQIAHQILSCEQPLQFDERLRERDFGDWELTPDSAYERVWAADEINPDNHNRGVESPNQVMQRVTALVYDLEQTVSDTNILIVSHGDALQILQTAFSKQDASNHRLNQHLETAEIRRLMI